MDYIRNKAGNEIELLHDTHERLSAINAVRLAKELEPYHLFFLEDIPVSYTHLSDLRVVSGIDGI